MVLIVYIKHFAEIEFIIPSESAVYPIEVKAGINTKAKSLKVFLDLFNPPFAIRTSLMPHKEGTAIKDIPLYAFGAQLNNLLHP